MDIYADDVDDCLSCIAGYVAVDGKCSLSINRSWIWIMSVVSGVVVTLMVGAGVAVYKCRQKKLDDGAYNYNNMGVRGQFYAV